MRNTQKFMIKRLRHSMATIAMCYLFIPLLVSEQRVLFSPDDRPTKHLVKFINEAKQSIYAAVYMITDKVIANALIKAYQRGVDVQLIIDKSTVESPYGKGKMLASSHMPLFVFGPDATKTEKDSQQKMFAGRILAIMHNKFAIFDNKILWTGSFNWTRSANQQNAENVLISDEKQLIQTYARYFETLKKKCHCIAGQRSPEAITNHTYFSWKKQLTSFLTKLGDFFSIPGRA